MRFRRYDARDLSVLASIGDSITANRPADGIQTADTYNYLIAAARGYARTINAGIAGNTTTQMLARFQTDVLNYRPGAISIMGGVNDVATNFSGNTWIGGGTSAATVKSNIKAMIQQGQSIGARVTLMSIPPWRTADAISHLGVYITAMAEAAAETGADYFDLHTRLSGLSSGTLDTYYLVDNVHLSKTGQAYVASMAAEPIYAKSAFRMAT